MIKLIFLINLIFLLSNNKNKKIIYCHMNKNVLIIFSINDFLLELNNSNNLEEYYHIF